MASHSDVDALIERTLKQEDLTSEDILNLTIARRLNDLSDTAFAQALGGSTSENPGGFWGRR